MRVRAEDQGQRERRRGAAAAVSSSAVRLQLGRQLRMLLLRCRGVPGVSGGAEGVCALQVQRHVSRVVQRRCLLVAICQVRCLGTQAPSRPQARSWSGPGSTNECIPQPARGPGRTRECTDPHTGRGEVRIAPGALPQPQALLRSCTQVPIPAANDRPGKLAGQGRRPVRLCHGLPAAASASLRGQRLHVLVLHRSRVPRHVRGDVHLGRRSLVLAGGVRPALLPVS